MEVCRKCSKPADFKLGFTGLFCTEHALDVFDTLGCDRKTVLYKINANLMRPCFYIETPRSGLYNVTNLKQLEKVLDEEVRPQHKPDLTKQIQALQSALNEVSHERDSARRERDQAIENSKKYQEIATTVYRNKIKDSRYGAVFKFRDLKDGDELELCKVLVYGHQIGLRWNDKALYHFPYISGSHYTTNTQHLAVLSMNQPRARNWHHLCAITGLIEPVARTLFEPVESIEGESAVAKASPVTGIQIEVERDYLD